MDTRRRPINAAVLEARERTSRVRAAARKGKTAQQIAQVNDYPLKMVEQILAPIADVRLSDPAALLNNRPVPAGLPPADVQVYWVGFLTASGRICGQGASFALIITLGERSQDHMNTFVDDLATPQVRNEYCESSVLGWQLYVRDQSLCKALLRWGVPSDLDGADPTVLDDLPNEFIAPFLRGYLDGGRTATSDSGAPRSSGLALYGTEAVLAAINTMVSRGWGIKSGVVKPKPPRAELKFNKHDAQTILTRSRAYTTRRRG